MTDSRPKVALCIPSSDTWKATTAFAMVCMSTYSAFNGIVPILINDRGGDAAENRNLMVMRGRGERVDWFLFIDADMNFPPDALARLLKWDVDIVGADYRMRAHPFKRIGLSPEGAPYPATHPEPTEGLVERGVLGLGLVLVRASVFEKLPAPWFARTWIPEHATPDNPFGFSTDDSYFFHYCHHHGFKLWCDIALTRETQHIGEIAVPWELKRQVG